MCIGEQLQAVAERRPEADAILAPGRPAMTYGALVDQMHRIRQALARRGIARGQRVAAVLPQGPELATAYLAVAASAQFAPLDPDIPEQGLRRTLRSLGVSAVMAPAEGGAVARQAAQGADAPVIDVVRPDGAPAGMFRLEGDTGRAAVLPGVGVPDDVALLLSTSGTTRAPKTVPLTHDGLCFSALAIAEVCRLGPTDRCLNVMPLFHLHALSACVLAPLLAGGSVVYPGVFEAEQALDLIAESGITYYSAAPAFHRALLGALRRRDGAPVGHRLRFIRSAASSLPADVLRGLESAFGAPVVESYGMTEASPQITSNPLPPGERRIRSVGMPAGPQVAVWDESGRSLPPGHVGQVAVRGRNVIERYEADEEVNAEAFRDGWLLTGDMGHVDEDGYLYLSGRVKEMINRGGETIAPGEVEQALAAHPDVLEAGCFGLPHERLGQQLAAVLVLRQGAEPTLGELAQAVTERLPARYVPVRICTADALPRTATGKLQRARLADLSARPIGWGAPAAPAVPDALMRLVRSVWEQVLPVDEVPLDANFFELGGDSMDAARMLTRLEALTGARVSGGLFYAGPTPDGVARALLGDGEARRKGPVVPIQPLGERPPLFVVCPGTAWILFPLAKELGPDQPVFGLSEWGLPVAEPVEVGALARSYVRVVRQLQGRGPYHLGGVSAGGVVALEMACLLREGGQEVGMMMMLDTLCRVGRWAPFWGLYGVVNRALGSPLAAARGLARLARSRLPGYRPAQAIRRDAGELIGGMRQASIRWQPRHYAGRVTYLWSLDTRILALRDPRRGWEKWCEELVVHRVPGFHHESLAPPNVSVAASIIGPCLANPPSGRAGSAGG